MTPRWESIVACAEAWYGRRLARADGERIADALGRFEKSWDEAARIVDFADQPETFARVLARGARRSGAADGV